jgi:predicted membrane protein
MRNNLFLGIILIAFGIFFLLDNFGVADFGDLIHDYWPLLIIVWGLSILLRYRSDPASPANPGTPPVDRETLKDSVAFGNYYSNISSSAFRGGSVSTVFGNCDIDLTKATFAPGEHTLKISGVFGDTNILLPKDSAVAVTAKAFLGTLFIFGQRKDAIASELTITSPNYEGSPNRLKIKVSKFLGSARIA